MRLVLPLLIALIPMPLEAALIAAWGQDEAAGNLFDSTGNHPDGIPTGTPTYAQPGVPNGSYGSLTVLDAAGTSIEYGPSAVDEFFIVGTDNVSPVMDLDTTAGFTVMGWINPAAATIDSTYRLVSTGSAAGIDRGWGIGLRLIAANNGVGSSIRFTNYGIADNDSSLFNVAFGTWIHLAATYNNGSINYFLNGDALGSDLNSFGNELAAGRLVIGGRLGGNNVDQANGFLDGIRVYDEVLSLDQIRIAAVDSVSVPEPSTMLLGLIALPGMLRRRRR